MAGGLTIDASQLGNGAAIFALLTKELSGKVSDVLNKNAAVIVTQAKQTAPADRGDVKKYISATDTMQLVKHITCRVPYAAYILSLIHISEPTRLLSISY